VLIDTGNGADNDGNGSADAIVQYNYISSANARAVRVRNSRNALVSDNRIVNILTVTTTATNTGTIHLGDPDSGIYDLGNLLVSNNTFVLAGNTPQLVWSRYSLNGFIANNTVVPGAFTGGYFGFLRDSTGLADTKTFKNNNMGGWTGTAGVVVTTQTATTAHVCNSGTGGGTGTVDAICQQ
jgi:hypothetical protein